ncbi:hypothetical protein QBC39DRAFT_128797 [Podospora conica]|nr:hypothetical protein QBC39DRAFT_128797 [Schizothecium conicum]
MVYESFFVFFLALSTTQRTGHGVSRRGEEGRGGGGSWSGFLTSSICLCFCSPMSPPKKSTHYHHHHHQVGQGWSRHKFPWTKYLRHHYGIKFPSFSVLPEVRWQV